MSVLKYHDPLTSALLGPNRHGNISSAARLEGLVGKHRQIPHRLYLIGCVIYNAAVAAAIGGASWAFLVLVLSLESA